MGTFWNKKGTFGHNCKIWESTCPQRPQFMDITHYFFSIFLSSIACAKEKCLDRHSFVNLLWGLETALSCSNSKHMQTHLKFPCIKVIGLQWFTINLSIILSLVGFRDISKDNDLYCQKLLIVKRWGSPLKRECAAFCQFWKILVGKEGQTRNRWQCLTIQWLKCPVSF